MWHGVFLDIRDACRAAVQRPGWTLLVVSTLGLGLGANAGVFAFLTSLLWPPIEAPDADRLVRIDGGRGAPTRKGEPWARVSYPDLDDYRAASRTLEAVEGSWGSGVRWRDGDSGRFTWGLMVTGGYFALFGARAHLGRLVEPGDERPGAPPIVVLGHRFWRRELGADPALLGRSVALNGHPFTVVGVAPPGFQGSDVVHSLYVPVLHLEALTGTRVEDRDADWLLAVGRLAPGVTPERAQSEMAGLARGFDERYPSTREQLGGRPEARQVGVRRMTTGEPGPKLWQMARMLMAAVALLLMLTVANVGNLWLARGAGRRREIAVRTALGAGRGRLLRRLLVESVLLALAGGAAGLGVARLLTALIESYLSVPALQFGDWAAGTRSVTLEPRALLFGLGLSLIVGLVFGLAPGLQATRLDVAAELKATGGGGGGRWGVRQLLVTSQVALSVMMLLAAGLLVRTFLEARTVDPGFDSARLLVASFYTPLAEASSVELFSQLLEGAVAEPGVAGATLARSVPLGGWQQEMPVALAGRPDDRRSVVYNTVGPGYFETLRIPLVRGRALDRRDRRESGGAVVVNQALAGLLWPGRDPVGERLLLPRGDAGEPTGSFEVVGVAADSRLVLLTEEPRPMLFVSYQQRFPRLLTLLVRVAGEPAAFAGALRERLWEISSTLRGAPTADLSLINLLPFAEYHRRALLSRRLNADVAVLFGLFGLGLATLGIFGVMSDSVRRRSREMGIRMALGATPGDARRLVLREAGVLAAAGLLLGIGAGLGLSRLLTSQLYGVTVTDPWTFFAVSITLFAVTLWAADLPARRAARMEPHAALREE